MAIVKGNYGALNQLTKNDSDFGAIARQQEQVETDKRAEQREIDQIKKDDAAKARKAEMDLADKKVAALGNIDDVVTGVDSYDEAMAIGINKATQRLIEVVEALDKDPTNTKLMLEQANLLKYSDRLAQMSRREKEYALGLAEGIKNGTYDAELNKDVLGNLSDKYKNSNFFADIDEQGNPVFKERLADGTGAQRNYKDMFDGSWLSEPAQAYNETNFFAGTDELETLDDIKTDYNGTKTRTKKLSPASITALDNDVNNRFGMDNETATSQAKSYWLHQMGGELKDFDVEMVKEDAKNKALARHGIIDEKSHDANLNFKKQQAAKKDKDKEEETPFGNISTMTDTATGKPVQGGLPDTSSSPERAKFKDATPFTFGDKPIAFGEGDDAFDVKSYLVSPDGRVALTGTKKVVTPKHTIEDEATGEEIEVPEKVTYEKIPYRVLNETESNLFARRMKMKNANQLYEVSMEKKKQSDEEYKSKQQAGATAETNSRLNNLPD